MTNFTDTRIRQTGGAQRLFPDYSDYSDYSTRGCPSNDLSFCDSSHDADGTLVIPDPMLPRRSALSFSSRGREHAERGVRDRSTIVQTGPFYL